METSENPAAPVEHVNADGVPRAPQSSELTREYSTPAITVEWYATRCIHSANCIRSLHHVFDPRRHPWIELEGADVDAIARAVLLCPSGALHFVRHDGGVPEVADTPTTFTPVRDGPVYARGDLEARAADGTLVRRDTRMALCRCGLTTHVPTCDTSCRAEEWHEPQPPAAGETLA